MKTCFKCGVTKPLMDFYAHPKMADGHLNKCKECAKRDMWESRHVKHRDRVLSYDRQRSSEPHRAEMRRRISRKWKEDHPAWRKAQLKLWRAVCSGTVTPWPACAIPECSATKVEAHHADYENPLGVVWLCVAHHRQAHALFSKLVEVGHDR